MRDAGLKVKTKPVPVRIITAEFEIEGKAHTKPGGYSGRVTDILNMSKISFLPITDARYRRHNGGLSEFVESDCVAVRISNIEILDFL